MKPSEIQDKLGLTVSNIRQRNWYVQPACAINGDGLNEGLAWLMTNHKWTCLSLFVRISHLNLRVFHLKLRKKRKQKVKTNPLNQPVEIILYHHLFTTLLIILLL